MAVLVVGGAGYIGSITVRALQRAGHDVVVFDDLSTGFLESVPDGVTFVEGSIHDGILVERIVAERGIRAAIHFAAKKSVADSMIDPARYFHENITGSNTLLEALARGGVRHLVFSSTAAVYGNAAVLPVTEDAPKQPESPYGESKWTVERMLTWFGVCHGLSSVSLRYFNAAGATDDGTCGEDFGASTNLVPVLMKAVLGRRPPLEVFGTDYDTRDGTCIRDYVHVEDLAVGHVKALDYLESGGDITAVNLGTAHGSTVCEVIAAAERVLGVPVPHVEAPRRPGDPAALYASVDKAAQVLGWRPERGLDDIFESERKWRQFRPDGFTG
jgi:UDP-glucose-4-epimerase GalE